MRSWKERRGSWKEKVEKKKKIEKIEKDEKKSGK